MNYELRHREVIERFGYARLAECLRLSRTTVHSWQRAGVIPSRYHAAILNAARQAGVELGAADFLGPAESGVAASCDVQ
jgi:hypothetical protein